MMALLSAQVVEEVTSAPTIDISLIISIISLAISFCVFAKDLWHERLRIDVTLINWFASHANDQPFFLWLVIQNNSSLPFSVLKIELTGKKGESSLYAVGQGSKKLIATHRYNDTENKIYSLDYPVIVNAYEGIGGYFHFVSDCSSFNFEDQTVSLIVYTTRGKRTIKNLRLRFGDNIMRAYQHKTGENPITHDSEGNLIKYTKEEL